MNIVVVGGGHAGVEACAALREAGHLGSITLVDAQAHLPYHRPPLSKDVLKSGIDAATPLRHRSFYGDNNVELISGVSAVNIDRSAQTITLSDGSLLPYGHLILATGSDSIGHPVLSPSTDGVHFLRTMDDAHHLYESMQGRQSVAIIGAGFIGLETAAAVQAMGASATVIAHSSRIMSRSLSTLMAESLHAKHVDSGVNIILDTHVKSIGLDDQGHVRELVTDAAGSIRADLVLVGIGVRPRSDLARAAGLAVDDGILVNGHLRTSDESISAIGDCARFPTPGNSTSRLECVQNATEQARYVAAVLTGANDIYHAVPWFWSVQGPVRLQIAGVAGQDNTVATFGYPNSTKFSVLRFDPAGLRCVESMNDPGTHLNARKLLARERPISVAEASAYDMDLRALFRETNVAA